MPGSETLIRAARDEDRDFMLRLAPRMAEVANLPWRQARDLLDFQHRFMKAAFAGNRRARDFYRRLGYQEDSLRLTKPLNAEWVS